MDRFLFLTRVFAGALLALTVSGCFRLVGSEGGGQTTFEPPRRVEPADVALPAGYRIEAVAEGLTFPTAVVFDGAGTPHVVEAGYSYGEVWRTPRLLRLGAGGAITVVAEGTDNGPWTGAAFHRGAFYIAEGGELHGGRILRVEPGGGGTRALVGDLPSRGDHHTNGVAAGPDGWLYYSVGTATNSGVVGTDNHRFGWLKRFPTFHDIPCRDVVLAGVNYTTANPFEPEKDQPVVTGAFVPFGTPTTPGQVVRGARPCSGAVFRIRPEGGPPELVAWGFRNPFGLAFAPDGRLYVTENAFDERGSRPVFGAGDVLWAVTPGAWHGWPDYHAGRPVFAGERFRLPDGTVPRALLAEPPNPPPRPAALFAVHASANGLDFARSGAFGPEGHAFVAQFGDQAPEVGKVVAPVGYRVVRVDPASGVVTDFAANRGPTNGPASWLGSGGLERPVAVRFAPDGRSLYVVDFGVMTMGEGGPEPRPGTGVLWRISRD